MNLLVMRHGIAEDPRGSDFSRELTQQGVAGVAQSIDLLIEKQVLPTKIFASPLIRAQQTAGIVAKKLGFVQTILTLKELSPSARPQKTIKLLQLDSVDDVCLLVSHQPFVSIFIRYLTETEVFLDTANIACISLEVLAPNCGDLEWLIRA